VSGGPLEKVVKAATKRMEQEQGESDHEDDVDEDMDEEDDDGNFLLIYICNFHVLNHLLLIYICKLHWIDDYENPKKHGVVGDRITVTDDESGLEKTIDLTNADTLTDADGHVWSGTFTSDLHM
jgi:hypothetical protein